MRYDMDELWSRVSFRRRKYLILLSLFAVALAACAVTIFLCADTTVRFVAIAIILLDLFCLSRLNARFSPSVLFSREVCGENILEDETVFGGSRVKIYRRVNMPNTGANQTTPHYNRRAEVYLRCEGGAVVSVGGLSAEHTELYEIGDKLLKFAGTRYPIVISREVKRQPCPLCGRINKYGDNLCGCGLKIIYEGDVGNGNNKNTGV